MGGAVTAYPLPKVKVPPDAKPTRTFRGSMRWNVIAELVQEYGWTRGAEIGTADGRTSGEVLTRCPGLHMIVIDVWAPQPGHDGPEDWMGWPHATNETLCRVRLSSFNERVWLIKGLSGKVAGSVKDRSLDFVFLDADHGEAGIRADWAAWAPKLQPGGMMLVHDINWPSVRAAMDDLAPGYWIGPNNVAGATP